MSKLFTTDELRRLGYLSKFLANQGYLLSSEWDRANWSEQRRIDKILTEAPVDKAGLAKDFRKLCNLAGYRDQQACFSMFRHRFITVLAHLKQWEAEKGRIVGDQDYRSILERVRVKTGHASVDSLWHYIDLAQKMGGVWGNVD